jgi:hypothetical protein
MTMRMFGSVLAVAILGVSLQACGSSGDGASASKFIGIWHPTSGTTTVTCPGLPVQTQQVTDNLTWVKGATNDLVSTDTSNCVLNANISGSTAVGMGVPCTFDDGAGGTAMLTITSYTFALSADGQTAQENGSGTLVDNNSGATFTCTANLTASYQKISG